jgi:hypothetical protein
MNLSLHSIQHEILASIANARQRKGTFSGIRHFLLAVFLHSDCVIFFLKYHHALSIGGRPRLYGGR